MDLELRGILQVPPQTLFESPERPITMLAAVGPEATTDSTVFKLVVPNTPASRLDLGNPGVAGTGL